MITANYVLLALGILGGADILLYHSISHSIRSHADSRWELLTHSMRGPTYATLFLVMPNFETRGAWAIVIALLLIVDFGISVVDFALERKSRANLGGLPSGEYVLHMVMAMLFGAFVALLAPILTTSACAETILIPSDHLAALWVRITLAIFATGVLASGFLDAVAAVRLTFKTQARSV